MVVVVCEELILVHDGVVVYDDVIVITPVLAMTILEYLKQWVTSQFT